MPADGSPLVVIKTQAHPENHLWIHSPPSLRSRQGRWTPLWPPLHRAGCGLLQRDNPGEGSSLSFASPFVSAPRLGSAGPQQGCTSSEPFPNSGTSASRHSSLMASAHLEAICARDEMHALCAGRWEFGRGGCCTHTHTHTHAHARTPSMGVGTRGHAPRQPRVQGSALGRNKHPFCEQGCSNKHCTGLAALPHHVLYRFMGEAVNLIRSHIYLSYTPEADEAIE